MDMIAIDRSCVNHRLVRPCRLAQRFPTPDTDISTENRVAVLRHPDQVILAVPNGMAATLVRFHPTNFGSVAIPAA
jgi:hypothetical protein